MNGDLTMDILGALTSFVYGAARGYAAINGRTKLGTVVDAVAGAGGLIAKNYIYNPTLRKMSEALSFSGFTNLGLWSAAVLKEADNIPFWRPGAEETATVELAPKHTAPVTPVAVPAPEPAPAPVKATSNVSALEI